MSRYRYSGPVMGLTLSGPDGRVVSEEILVPGRTYTLPPDHPRVVALVAAHRLTPSEAAVAASAAPAPTADAPPTDPTPPPAAVAARRRRTKEL